MIDFEITETQREYVQLAHNFAKDVMRPAERELDRYPNPEEVYVSQTFREVLCEAYRLGFHKMSYPAHIGGLGLDPLTVALITEELYWGGPGLGQTILVGGFAAHAALMSGKSSLIKEFAVPYCNDTEAKHIGAFAGVEPHVGSDIVYVTDPKIRLSTTARKEGDEYVINGSKAALISNGGFATAIGVAACLEPERGIRGTGLFLVPGDTPGITRGKPLDKLGLRCLNQAAVYFDEVRVPKRYLTIRPRGDNWINFVRSFVSFGNLGVGLTALALMRSAYEDALDYAQDRIQGGQPIIEHANIAMKLFDAFQTIEAARCLLWKTAWTNANQFPGDVPTVAAARCFASNQATRITGEMIQVLGGYAVEKGSSLEKYYRDAKLTQIEDGAVDTMALIGLRLLYEPDYGRESRI